MSVWYSGGGAGGVPLSPEEIERRAKNKSPVLASLGYDPESITSFKNRVDELIKNLKDSPAGSAKLDAEALSRSQFGGGGPGWIEAAGLADAYTTVIDQLKQLSKLLADSLEGMGIAVVASKDGIEQLDDDIRRRMLAIERRAKAHYDSRHDQEDPGQHQDRGQSATPPGDTSGGTIQ